MRRLLPLLLLAACTRPAPPPPEPAFGYEQPDRLTDGLAASWGAAEGMPLDMRAKFEARPGPVYIPPPEPGTSLDSLGAEFGDEDVPAMGEEIAAMFRSTRLTAGWELDAGLFVLYREGAGSIEAVLAAWSGPTRRLTWLSDLAWTRSEPGFDERTEGWLVDLDGDGYPEMVQRSTVREIDSGLDETGWTAFTIDPGLGLLERSLTGSERTMLLALASGGNSHDGVPRTGE